MIPGGVNLLMNTVDRTREDLYPDVGWNGDLAIEVANKIAVKRSGVDAV